MQWTIKRKTWLGTSLEKRGACHGIPFVIRGYTGEGLTARGRAVLALAAVVLIAIVLLQEFVI